MGCFGFGLLEPLWRSAPTLALTARFAFKVRMVSLSFLSSAGPRADRERSNSRFGPAMTGPLHHPSRDGGQTVSPFAASVGIPIRSKRPPEAASRMDRTPNRTQLRLPSTSKKSNVAGVQTIPSRGSITLPDLKYGSGQRRTTMLKYAIVFLTLVSKLALISLNAEPAGQPGTQTPDASPVIPATRSLEA